MKTKLSKSHLLINRTILIVEDDHFISRVYTRWLRAVGANIVVANDGAQCLRILGKRRVDLVLLDLGMPGLNGYDTLIQLRENLQLKDLPVVILSNTTMNENRSGFEEIKKAGVKDILQKYETSLGEIVRCICSYFPEDAHMESIGN